MIKARIFHADVVDRAGDHEIGLAEGDLVDALFEGDGRGGAGGLVNESVNY